MKYYGLYKITNLTNGKMYIGQHVTENLDDGYMGSGKLIKLAINKYGVENFRKEWLGFYEDADELDYMERVFVDETWVSRSDTYNLSIGGYSGKWGKPSPLKGRHISDEHKAKISRAFKGEKHFNFGKHLDDQLKEKISRAHKGKRLSDEARKSISMGHIGTHKSEEVKAKISESIKGRHYYNNGVFNVMRYECPDGFVPGYLTPNNKRK